MARSMSLTGRPGLLYRSCGMEVKDWFRQSRCVIPVAGRRSLTIQKTYEEKEQSSIATASSSNCGEVSICLWVRKHPRETVPTFSRRSSTDGSVVIQLAMTIMVIIFLYQNMMPYVSSPFKTYDDF